MPMPSAADARTLIRRAWTLRCETLTASTASEAEARAVAEKVRGYLVEAVAICRAAGADRELVTALGKLGHVEQDAGRHDAARVCFEEAVAAARTVADPLQLAHAVRHLGAVFRQVEEARMLWGRARELYGAAGIEAGVAECTDHLDRLG